MYVTHYDVPGEQWNVFKLVNGNEEYVASFLTSQDAIAFVTSANQHARKN